MIEANDDLEGGNSMAHILIVDDEAKIRQLIQKYAAFEGFETSEASNGMEAIDMCQSTDFDLIVMDVMMPELDGFSTVKEIRRHKKTPILMLSARGEEYDKIHGFELGIDDYVVKPFSGKELMMRIRAILSRTSRIANAHEISRVGALQMDFTARIVSIDDERINLTTKEFELLACFMRHPNIALTREQLIQNIWGYDFMGDDRTLDTHIKSLRKALAQYSECIVTLRGVGYRFEDQKY